MSFRSKHSSPRSRFDHMREEAFTKSHRHPLELQFDRQRRSSGVLPVIAGGIVAAISVTVVAALVFFNVVPTLKSDPSLAVSISTPALAAAAHAAPEDPQALLRKFVEFQESQGNDNPRRAGPEISAAGISKAPESSQALLEKFVQWQQRRGAAPRN